MKKFLLCNIILCLFCLSACNNKTDSTLIDEQISSIIKNMGEENISLDEELNSSFIVNEIAEEENTVQQIYQEYENPYENPEILLAEEKLPAVPGFSFENKSMAEMEEFSTEPFDYLGITWIPTKVACPRPAYGDAASLYLTSMFYYGKDDLASNSPSQFNLDYLDLLSETIHWFGNPIYEFNTDIIDLGELKEKGPISMLFETVDYYLVCLIEDDIEEESIIINYYFLSTEMPHADKEERALIDFVMKHDADFNLKVYYETSEGNFIL